MNILDSYENVLKKVSIFKNIEVEALKDILKCLNCYPKLYHCDDIIFHPYDNIEKLGVVLDGIVDLQTILPDGSTYLINRLYISDIFGESYATSGITNGSTEFISKSETVILFLDIPRVTTTKKFCKNPNKYVLMENLMNDMSRNNVFLNDKLHLLSQRSLRNKILMYFEDLSIKQNKKDIVIPFNREELARYLTADRSAVSRELSRMKKEGLINLDGNNLIIK